MRIPSRKMPQVHAPGPSWLGWLLGLAVVSLTLAVLAKLWWPLAILVPAAIWGIDAVYFRPRDRRIAKDREGESICQFARGFDCRSVDTWIIRAVYEEFSGSFPLRPSDRLKEDLHIAGDDVDYAAMHIAKRTGRGLNGSERNPLYGKIKTLRDVVMFFHHQPRDTA
jgi:hypothetical protein